jgi:hypothetical protein
MKKFHCSLILVIALSLCSLSSLAQRPEQMYVRRGLLGLGNTKPVKTPEVAKARPAQPQLLSTCPSCQTIPFNSFSPNGTFMSVYGSDSVWVDTYTGVTPDPTYSGSYLNFDAGCINFTHYADNSFPGFSYWDGFTVSKTTSLTCGLACNTTDCAPDNQFAAITLAGVGGATDPYVVGYDGYNDVWFPARHTTLSLASANSICGLYVTNSAYAYRSMKCGDWLTPQPFGQGDYFIVRITGYLSGSPVLASPIDYYLADFTGSTQAYIEDQWKWVNLSSLGTVDALEFSLITSNTGANGPNTPMYFCLDGIKVGTGGGCGECAATDNTHNWFPMPGNRIAAAPAASAWQVKVSPNPAFDQVSIVAKAGGLLEVFDGSGNVKLRKKLAADRESVSIAGYRPGVYSVKVTVGKEVKTAQFLKQ